MTEAERDELKTKLKYLASERAISFEGAVNAVEIDSDELIQKWFNEVKMLDELHQIGTRILRDGDGSEGSRDPMPIIFG